MKTCPKCKLEKELQFFYKDKQTSDGFTCWCIDCKKKRQQHYNNRPEVKEQRKEYQIAYIALNPLQAKDSSLKRLYNISIEDYNQMFSNQNGCCAICKRHQSEFKKALAVDHDHKTGQVRGLLCSGCNLALGNAEDSIEILSSAIQYLTQSQSTKG